MATSEPAGSGVAWDAFNQEETPPMPTETRLRPAQEEVLRYRGGRMAVSAVPGSGKTFTLSFLTAQLIADGLIDVTGGQQVLIVTYLNSSVDTFRSRIRDRLLGMGLLPAGYDVRTLHSLSLEIVRQGSSGDSQMTPNTVDETQSNYFLSEAIKKWAQENPTLWEEFVPDSAPQARVRQENIIERSARAFIRMAKNERYRPDDIWQQLATRHQAQAQEPYESWSLSVMLAGIYRHYQTLLAQKGLIDFDDQVWKAVELLERQAGLAQQLRDRWPYVLEDEAQDSVPLQEDLLQLLSGASGNLVRVGDPNQAITSTFTAAHPKFFNHFIDRDDVLSRPLPNSGRCAPRIIGAANALVDWVCTRHPVPEVRELTFRQQHIQPAPAGDAQPNPPDAESNLLIKLYRHREEEEIPEVARLAQRYLQKFPQRTAAILVPTNALGHEVAAYLDEQDMAYDTLLRGGANERQVATTLRAVLALLANPLQSRALKDAYAALREVQHPAATLPLPNEKRFDILLQSVHAPEQLLFPNAPHALAASLPSGIAGEQDLRQLELLAHFLRSVFDLRPLPIDDLTVALADELFAHTPDHIREGDLSIAHHLASVLRAWRDQRPELRLPDLVLELAAVAEGQRSLGKSGGGDSGFEPKKGRITLATQHAAKGMEWDAVFLVSIDGYWIPGDLDAYFQGMSDVWGGDPTAEAVAQLRYLMQGDAGAYPGRTPTESAHIDIISERLRLLYVGITRAKRFLQISRSRATRSYEQQNRENIPATAIGAIYHFLQNYEPSPSSAG